MVIRSLLFIFILTSCSNLKRTVMLSSVIGAGVGAAGGQVFSPNKESEAQNTYLFALLGAFVAGISSYYIMREPDPNKPLKKMILDDSNKDEISIGGKELGLFDFSEELKNIKPKISFAPVKKYEVPIEQLPAQLRGKVKKQYLIEYESKEKTIQVGTKTIQISPFKAWEHVYE